MAVIQIRDDEMRQQSSAIASLVPAQIFATQKRNGTKRRKLGLVHTARVLVRMLIPFWAGTRLRYSITHRLYDQQFCTTLWRAVSCYSAALLAHLVVSYLYYSPYRIEYL